MRIALRISLRVNRVFALLLVFFVVNVLPILAQRGTTIDEVHIQPRVMQPFTKGTMVPVSVPEAGPKPMKVKVNLVLVPVTITDGMNRLVQGLDRNIFQVLEEKNSRKSVIFPARTPQFRWGSSLISAAA